MKREPIKGDELKKKAVDEEDDSMENEDEMEEKSCGTKKSVEITEDDLMKSVEQLEAFAKADDPISRKNELLEKAQKEDLTDSEKDELFKALGKEEEEVVEEESVTKSFEDNEDMQKSLDVSDYLSDLHTGLVKALGTFEAKQTASDARQHEFNILLAKSVAQVGKLMKSLNDLEHVDIPIIQGNLFICTYTWQGSPYIPEMYVEDFSLPTQVIDLIDNVCTRLVTCTNAVLDSNTPAWNLPY